MISLLTDRKSDIRELCPRNSVAEVEVFGSAARGDFNLFDSDVDIAVRFRRLSPRDYRNCYFGLLFALEDLLGRKVDLVDLDTQVNPAFTRSIAVDKQVLYAATS